MRKRQNNKIISLNLRKFFNLLPKEYISQVGFSELKKAADDRANIGGTIIGAPIVGQQLAQYILTDHQDADCTRREFLREILYKNIARIAIQHGKFIFLYTCMQNPRLRTVYRQWKWPLLAPVRKIMALRRKKMALVCKIIALGWNVFE